LPKKTGKRQENSKALYIFFKKIRKGVFMEMTEQEKIKNGICPSCGAPLIFQEGCMTCQQCGWGACDG